VIRFLCPHCSRRYELPEALARLPLVCKGCGQPLAVPEKSTEPEPQPEAHPEPPKPAPMAAPKPNPPPTPRPAPAPVPAPAPEAKPVVVAIENRLPPPEKPSANGPLAPHPNGDGLFEKPDVLAALDAAVPAPPSPQPVTPTQTGGPKLLGVAVDAVVALILIAVGVFCGELLARQSTRDVLKDASSAATFPPVDLLMWLAPSVLFLLIQVLLISRGKSLGSRLARRGAE
jgi:hypothetical protein